MHVRHAVAVVGLPALLLGCTTVPPARMLHDQSCRNHTTCDIDVDPALGGAPERVYATKGQANVIRWKLPHGSKWKWGDKGVEFKPPGNTVFNCPSGQSGPVRTCNKPANAPGGTFEYQLHLLFDPYFVNE